MAKREHPISQTSLSKGARLRERPGSAVGDLHHAGVLLVIRAERFSARGFAIGKNKFHIAVGSVANVCGRQHHAILGNDDAAAGDTADFHGDHCIRHTREDGFDLSFDGFEVVERCGCWLAKNRGQIERGNRKNL